MSKDRKEDNGSSSFDIEKIRELIHLMEEHELSEIILKNEAETWKLKRGPGDVVQYAAPYPQQQMVAPPAQAAAPAGTSAEPAAAVDDGSIFVVSPTVGTFYQAPSPDDPPYVKVGDQIQPETVVCQIEAMKLFDHLKAGVSGTVVEILVKDGDAVGFNDKLFRVKPH